MSETARVMDTIGILCTVLVGFCILKFVLKFIYNNFLDVTLRVNAVNLKESGKWAGKYLHSILYLVLIEPRNSIGSKQYTKKLIRTCFTPCSSTRSFFLRITS